MFQNNKNHEANNRDASVGEQSILKLKPNSDYCFFLIVSLVSLSRNSDYAVKASHIAIPGMP